MDGSGILDGVRFPRLAPRALQCRRFAAYGTGSQLRLDLGEPLPSPLEIVRVDLRGDVVSEHVASDFKGGAEGLPRLVEASLLGADPADDVMAHGDPREGLVGVSSL